MTSAVFGIQNNSECWWIRLLCEEISGAVGGAGLGNGDAGGVVVGSFERGGGCFSACSRLCWKRWR